MATKNNFSFIEEDNFEKARKKIRENKGKKIIFSGKDDDLNRKILEKEDIDTLLIKTSGKKDKSKQRDSGFDSVMAKISKKRKVNLGIYLDEIINSKGIVKTKILGRVIQNIKLCNKNNLNVKFVALKKENKRNPYDLKALGLVLGMPTRMVKDL